jgi:hypothetical protein
MHLTRTVLAHADCGPTVHEMSFVRASLPPSSLKKRPVVMSTSSSRPPYKPPELVLDKPPNATEGHVTRDCCIATSVSFAPLQPLELDKFVACNVGVAPT